ncbi:hypothetical protein A4X06_0g7206 [Tilletia controversa]|uniref:Uncharacterized protein n=1 Tax=Tilletia controversa TaxID=13291 RepID=A0A8X7MMC2_9BASI|nr:hypothetical protein A4X06_0g7206 [Tilletia controversa]
MWFVLIVALSSTATAKSSSSSYLTMSSIGDLHSPPVSDFSEADEIALSEISSFDGFELVEPEDTPSAAPAAPDAARAAPSPALTRRDTLRDRHEAVLLALRPELPPTVFHFPDPSAQSDDDDDDDDDDHHPHPDNDDEHTSSHSNIEQAVHKNNNNRVHAHQTQHEDVQSEAAASSSADHRSDSTRTTKYGLEKQPRWLARTSAWLATAGQGAVETEYAIPTLSLGTSFSQSCAEALNTSRLAAAAAAAASARERQDGSHFMNMRRRGKEFGLRSQMERWQPTSIFVLLALAATIFSLGLRLRTSPSAAPLQNHSSAAAAAAAVVVESRALGMPVPVSLQVWHAASLESRTGPMSASVDGPAEEPYVRVQRVLEARRQRRVAAATKADTKEAVKKIPSRSMSATVHSDPPHARATTTSPPKVEHTQSPSAEEASNAQQQTTEPDQAANQAPPPPPPLSLDDTPPTSLIDWNAVALFIQSLAAEARIFARLAHDVALRTLTPYVEQAQQVACQTVRQVRASWGAVRGEVEGSFGFAFAGPIVRGAREAALGGAQKSFGAASDAAHRSYDAASDAAQKSYDAASDAAHKSFDAASDAAHKSFHAVLTAADPAPLLKAAQDTASTQLQRARNAAAHVVQEESKPVLLLAAQVERRWRERNEAKAARYRERVRTRRAVFGAGREAKRRPGRAGFRTF